jgi:hypothetical protein
VIYAPKVAIGLSPGSRPWEPLKINEFALKGREADQINLAPIAAQELECGIEACDNLDPAFALLVTFDLPPLQLQGAPLWMAAPRVEILG